MVAWPGACRPETPCVGPTLGTIPSSPRYRLRLLRCLAVQRFRPKSAGRQVIKVKILAGPIVREADLEAATLRDGLVFDDANAVCLPAGSFH